MNAFFYFTLLLSVGLLSAFVFDSMDAIRYTLIGTVVVYLIALAVSNGLIKVSSKKPAASAGKKALNHQ